MDIICSSMFTVFLELLEKLFASLDEMKGLLAKTNYIRSLFYLIAML